MLKSLCIGAVSLLTSSCFSGTKTQENTKFQPLLTSVSNSYNNTIIYGTYNFRNEFNFDSFDTAYSDLSIVFEEEDSFEYLVPFNLNNSSGIYYLSNMSFEVHYDDEDVTEVDEVWFRIEYYDSWSNNYYSTTSTISNHSQLSDTDYSYFRSFFFDVLGSVYVNNIESRIVFDSLFTHNDNSYVITVNSYYNFTTFTSGINHCNCFGSIVFNNNMCVTLTTKEDGNSGNLGVETMNYDALNTHYVFNSYFYPINFEISTQNAIYFNGTKMSVTSYNNLSSIGVFAYVHDTTYDNTDFHDLLFSIADTPLYFIFRLLDWQLFGMNLFIAFAGLLTLAVVLVCIRRFF